MTTLYDRYKFFKANAGYIRGESAVCALALARAEAALEAGDLEVVVEPETESAEGYVTERDLAGIRDGSLEYLYMVLKAPATKCTSCGCSPVGEVLASLGGIVVESYDDPYLRVVAAQLALEAELDRLAA